jgi:hypothetical protein
LRTLTVTYNFSGGLLLSTLVLVVLIGIPVKVAAHFADAKRTGILWCCAAVALGFLTGYVAAWIFGGYIGGPLAGLLGFVFGIRLMLGTSFAAALGLSIIAFALSLAGLALLARLGMVVGGSPGTAVAI